MGHHDQLPVCNIPRIRQIKVDEEAIGIARQLENISCKLLSHGLYTCLIVRDYSRFSTTGRNLMKARRTVRSNNKNTQHSSKSHSSLHK